MNFIYFKGKGQIYNEILSTVAVKKTFSMELSSELVMVGT